MVLAHYFITLNARNNTGGYTRMDVNPGFIVYMEDDPNGTYITMLARFLVDGHVVNWRPFVTETISEVRGLITALNERADEVQTEQTMAARERPNNGEG